ncbi:hypothetical protein GCM10025776_20450 [Corallincola platygyrae]
MTLANVGDNVHAIVKFNFPARLFGMLGMLLLSWHLLGVELLSVSNIWILLFAVTWPGIARYVVPRFINSKKAEHFNLSVDAVFSAFYALKFPASMVLTALLSFNASNSLVSAGPKLLVRNLFLLTATFGAGLLIYGPLKVMSLGLLGEVLAGGFTMAYFCLCSTFSYSMAKRLVHSKNEVEERSYLDELTGCRNRCFFNLFLPKEFARAERMSYPISVVFADLDHFKRVNDVYGHHVGDRVLEGFAALARSNLREEIDWIARYGGEEFVIVLPGCDTREAIAVADRIRTQFTFHKLMHEKSEIRSTCSFGVASVRPSETNKRVIEDLLHRGDKALYQAKEAGRNRVEAAC